MYETEVSVNQKMNGKTRTGGTNYSRNNKSSSQFSEDETNINELPRCQCNRDLTDARKHARESIGVRERTRRNVNSGDPSELRDDGRYNGTGGGAKVLLPTNAWNDRTIIQLPEGTGTGTYVVPTPNIQVNTTNPPSQISINTKSFKNTTTKCIRPEDCKRMLFSHNEYNRLGKSILKQDQIALEEAMNELFPRDSEPISFDDFEELMEIFQCNEIGRRLHRLIDDKRQKVQVREARRNEQFMARKMDFHEKLIQRIEEDRREQSKLYENMLRLLNSASNEDDEGPQDQPFEKVTVKVTQENLTGNRFRPKAESTRLERNDRLDREANDTRKKTKMPNEFLLTDLSDDATFRKY